MRLDSAIAVLAAVAMRTWIKTLRRPVLLSFSFVQPMVWMLFFGFLFHRYPIDLAPPDDSYLSFLAPGIAAMTVLFGSSQAGIALIRDMQTDFLARMLRTPADHRLLLLGKLAADVVRVLAQAVVVLVLGVLVGARLKPSLLGGTLALAAVGLFALGFSSLSCFIALKTRAQESMAVFVHVVNMPLLFTSSALVPGKHMPAWLETAAAWNPLSLAVEALRGAALRGESPSLTQCIAPLGVVALGLFLLASNAMRAAARE